MNLLRIILLALSVFAIPNTFGGSYKPEGGYIQNEEVARKVGLAVLESIYGRDVISQQSPFNVVLENGVWYIQGSLPEGWLGGVAEIEIRQDNGEILRVFHHQ